MGGLYFTVLARWHQKADLSAITDEMGAWLIYSTVDIRGWLAGWLLLSSFFRSQGLLGLDEHIANCVWDWDS